MNREETNREIGDICLRLARGFGTTEILVIGSVAMRLACDYDRRFNDIDAVLSPEILRVAKVADFEKLGFLSENNDGLTALVDEKTGFEVELSNKNCGNFNEKLKLPAYDANSPTILGIPLRKLFANCREVEVASGFIKIPSDAHQVLSKYNLWRFRGEGKTDQKDALDLQKLVLTKYGNYAKFLAKEAGQLQENEIGSINSFKSSLRMICEAERGPSSG